MIFFHALPRTSVNNHPEMTLAEHSEREQINRRIEAAKRVRLKRLKLAMGLAAIRRSWRQVRRSKMPQFLVIRQKQRT